MRTPWKERLEGESAAGPGTGGGRSSGRGPWLRRLGLAIASTLLLLEPAGCVAWSALAGHRFSYRANLEAEAQALLDASAANPSSPRFAATEEVVHPFLGFVLDPTFRHPPRNSQGLPFPKVSRDGFTPVPAAAGPATGRELRVALVGGSMAQLLGIWAGGDLAAALAGSPRFAGRRVVVETFALGGYKQPQQLITLGYLASLGRHFDVVVNLDGYNDLVLSRFNAEDRTFPFYPRSWRYRTNALAEARTLRIVGARELLAKRRRALAVRMLGSPWRYSALASALWLGRDRRLAGEIAAADEHLGRLSRHGRRNYLAEGPAYRGGLGDLLPAAAALWERSSRGMDALCRGIGCEYWHFLQPNQYDPGGKPLAREEIRLMLHPYRDTAEVIAKGYPLLAAAGARLRAAGVRFTDLRRVFAAHPEPLYADECCHVGVAGDRLLALAIARVVSGPPSLASARPSPLRGDSM
jgi:hypothetical protein